MRNKHRGGVRTWPDRLTHWLLQPNQPGQRRRDWSREWWRSSSRTCRRWGTCGRWRRWRGPRPCTRSGCSRSPEGNSRNKPSRHLMFVNSNSALLMFLFAPKLFLVHFQKLNSTRAPAHGNRWCRFNSIDQWGVQGSICCKIHGQSAAYGDDALQKSWGNNM